MENAQAIPAGQWSILFLATTTYAKGFTPAILDGADKFWIYHPINTYSSVCMKIDIDAQ